MKYTLVLQLSGPLAQAVAVEWTDLDAPAPDGTGWEPCIRLADGRWRFASREGSALQPHLRDPGVFGNIAIRYRLEAAGPWSETAIDRKEITIVAAEDDDSGTLPPLPPVIPALIGGLGLAGSGKIGSPVTAEPGLWSGEPTAFAYQWCRDGADIAGANEAIYTPVADDDLTELSCRVIATGAGGQGEAVTAALRVTHVAPTAKGGLFDEIFDQGTGVQLVETAWDFTGEALVFSVEGAGATVDPATGVVGIPTEEPISGETVTITAANSGGSASSAFPVTVEAADNAPVLVALEADEWEIVELAEDPVHKGMVTAVIRFPAGSPAEDAVAAYWSDVSDPAALAHPTYDIGLDGGGRRRFRLRPAWKDSNTWHVRAPGESKPNIAIRYRLEPFVTDTGSYMDHNLPENLPLVSENSADRKSFAVPADFFGTDAKPSEPAAPAGNWPSPTTSELSTARSLPTPYIQSEGQLNNAYQGPRNMILAFGAMAGDSASTNELASSLKSTVKAGSRRDLPSVANTGLQYEQSIASGAIIAKRLVPSVWNALTTAEQTAWDRNIKSMVIAGLSRVSDANPKGYGTSSPDMLGGTNWSRSWSASHVNPKILSLHLGIAWFGSPAALKAYMDDYSHATLRGQLQSSGLLNAYATWNARVYSDAQVDASIRNWAYKGQSVFQHEAIWIEEIGRMMSRTFFNDHPDSSKIGGRGTRINPGTARIRHLGKVGMCFDLDTSDAGGIRTSMAYAMRECYQTGYLLIPPLACGVIDGTRPEVRERLERFVRYCDDMDDRTATGWRSYSKGGSGGGNEDWTASWASGRGYQLWVPAAMKRLVAGRYGISG